MILEIVKISSNMLAKSLKIEEAIFGSKLALVILGADLANAITWNGVAYFCSRPITDFTYSLKSSSIQNVFFCLKTSNLDLDEMSVQSVSLTPEQCFHFLY